MRVSDIFDLTGQVALVTGASSGLGLQFAHALASKGAAVVVAARRAERLIELKSQIEAKGGKALAVAADVTERSHMLGAFEAAEKAFGTVTILVNNAGIAHSSRAIDVSEQEWQQVLSTDLDAVFFWAQEAASRMIAAKKRGSVVNIASILGFRASKGTVAYSASKAAVVQVTKSLATEYGSYGVRVNAIAPGWFVTELTEDYLASDAGVTMKRRIPMNRFGEDGDLDGALLLLASDAGRFITGATIVVDGGQLAGLSSI
jgi:3-oxoacyl-[acyl-carrier protein] reductase